MCILMRSCHHSIQCRIGKRSRTITCSLFLLFVCACGGAGARFSGHDHGSGTIVTASRREKHDFPDIPQRTKSEWRQWLEDNPTQRPFPRFASAHTISKMFDKVRSQKSFRRYHGRDGRCGMVSSTNLGHDWVLAESKQVAVDTSAEQVLKTYLSGKLQTQWNADSVLSCQFTVPKNSAKGMPHYRQDLELKSQRVIRRHTGKMRYAQRIMLDKVGTDDDTAAFCAYVTLDKTKPAETISPFVALHVSVQLERQGNDTAIYAVGLFRVNRRVVPHLLVFDAAGLAGNMAGVGTLWLAAHFRQQAKNKH